MSSHGKGNTSNSGPLIRVFHFHFLVTHYLVSEAQSESGCYQLTRVESLPGEKWNVAMIRIFTTFTTLLLFVLGAQAQYLENFSGQNGKGLVDAICPAGTTNINNCGSACTSNAMDNTSTCTVVPPDLSGVNWTIVAPGGFFTTAGGVGFNFGSPDDFGVVSDRMQVNDPDNEICWVSPILNIGSAGAVSISVDVSESGDLDDEDYIRAEYSLNSGAYVQFGFAQNDFVSTAFTVSGLTGATLQIRVCAYNNGSSNFHFFDNVRVPQAGVSVGCSPPVITKVVSPAGSCLPNSGAIQVTATGATPGYNVAWGGPSSGNPAGTEIASSGGSYNITGLGVGTYTVTVTDANSCTATMTASVTQASALSLSTQVTNATCASDANGGINLTVSNGSAPYSYSWSNLPGSPDPEDQLTGLLPGTYTVTVTDNATCTATTSATVGVTPASPYLETFSIANKGYLESMTDDLTGVNWTLSPWSNGARDANDYFKTTGGKLEGIDFDEEVCWISPVLDISASGVVSISVAATWEDFDNPTGGSGDLGDYIRLQYSVDGAAYSTVPNQFGGGANGTVNYASGTGHDGSGTLTAGGISGNTLRIRICSNFNSNDEEVTFDNVSVPQNVSLACITPELSIAPTHVLCNGASTGALNLTVTDGTPPYTYDWSNDGAEVPDNDSQDLSSLVAGTYTVTVTDAANVTATMSATITQPPSAVTGGATTMPACNTNDGQINVTASGGTPGYQVKWGGTSSGDPAGVEIAMSGGNYSITGLTVGAYTVTVTDANGCSFTLNRSVSTAGCCMVSANAGTNKTICPGGSTAIGGAPTGTGTPTLSYAWAPAGTLNDPTLANPTATPAGNTTYTVTVTSTAGCTATASVTVFLYTEIVASASPTGAFCNGGNGKITMTLSGGTGPYDLNWSGPVSNSANNVNTGYMFSVPAGMYTITVTDENGCTKTATATVPEPPAIMVSSTPTDVSCTGDSNGKITLNVSGGFSPYTFNWNGPGANDGTAFNQNSPYMITNLPAGVYNITVSDVFGCSKTTTATVGTANPLPTCAISDPMAAVCPNSTGNQYSATAGMDSYLWSISGNGSIPGSKMGSSVQVTAGASGSYTVSVVITKNGCTSTCMKEVMIEQIPFSIVSSAQYCQNDPGPVIGLDGSELGAMYQLQTAGGTNLGAPVTGTGSAIVFGSYPNGNYKVAITGGTCNLTLQAAVNGSVVNCPASVPNFCNCTSPNGKAEVAIKVTAPAGQNWQVVEVVGLYQPFAPYNPITVGTPLTFVGMGMYQLPATRDNVKGFYVKVSNGFTEQNIQVGNPSW